MADELTLQDLDELEELWRRASPRDWSTGPTTLAGDVWVFERGGPVAEPCARGPWSWVAHRLRSDFLCRLACEGEEQWLRRRHERLQANAKLIVASVSKLPQLIELARKGIAFRDACRSLLETQKGS